MFVQLAAPPPPRTHLAVEQYVLHAYLVVALVVGGVRAGTAYLTRTRVWVFGSFSSPLAFWFTIARRCFGAYVVQTPGEVRTVV